MTTREAAVILGISIKGVQHLIRAGRLPATWNKGRLVLDHADVRKCVGRPGRGRPRKETP